MAVPNIPVTSGFAGAGKKGLFDEFLGKLGSPGGQTLIGGIGAGMEAYGAGKQADANRAASAAQSEAELRQRQLEQQQNDLRTRQMAAPQMLPMGAEQGFAQKQALMKALLGNARNVQFTPGDPAIAQAMGSYQGGMRLPDSGFDPAMLERLFGDEATQASIAAFQKNVGQVNPNMKNVDMGVLYGNSLDGSQNPFTTDVQTSNRLAMEQELNNSSKERQAVIEALRSGQQQKSSGGSKLGAVLKGAATFLPFFL